MSEEKVKVKGFRRVKYTKGYNGEKGRIELWECGKTKKTAIRWSPTVWVRDDKSDTGYTDVYGNKVRKLGDDETAPEKDLCESDLNAESLFLLDRYWDKDIETNINDFGVCFLDIEIAGGNGGHLPGENMSFKRTPGGPIEHLSLGDLEEVPGYKDFDIVYKGKFVKFRDTEYAKSDFPDPLKAEYPVNLITAYDSRTKKTVTFGIGEYTGKEVFDYRAYKTEVSLLKDFFDWFGNSDFDILTGWNSEHFDLTYLINRAYVLTYNGESGMLEAAAKLSPFRYIGKEKIRNLEESVKVSGLYVMDYLALYKKFTYSTEPSYKLDYIGQKVTGEGKVEYEGSIANFYKRDWNRFVEYNIQDVLLVKKIDDKLKFLDLAVTLAHQALVPVDKIFSAVATIEGYILRYFRGHKMVMPNRPPKPNDWWVEQMKFFAKEPKDPSRADSELIDVIQNVRDEDEEAVEVLFKEKEYDEKTGAMNPRVAKVHNKWVNQKIEKALALGHQVPSKEELSLAAHQRELFESMKYYVKGGYVETNPGHYTASLCFDVASLYPHIIIQYNISPETKVIDFDKEHGRSQNLIESEINGIWFKRQKGILPTIVKRIFDERSRFKKAMFKEEHGSDLYNYYNTMQLVRKVLINSMYGVFIQEFFHFYDPDLARSITRGGRRLTRFLVDKSKKAVKMLAAHPEMYFPGAKPFQLEHENVISLVDTDSAHVHFQELKEKLAPNMPERDFLKIMETYMEEAYEMVLQKKADVKGLEQVIRFKREGVITHELVVAKKHYVSVLVQNEDEIYETPKMKFTGVEIKRSDIPKWVKNKMIASLDLLFSGCTEAEFLKGIDNIYEDFKRQPVDEICSIGSVSNYHKYTANGEVAKAKESKKTKSILDQFAAGVSNDKPKATGMLKFVAGCPMRNKAAIAYNHFIKSHNLPYEKISDGSKIRYIPVKNTAAFGNDVIAWVDSCPKEIRDIIEINYTEQFKVFTGFINSVCDTVKFKHWTPNNFGFKVE